MARWVAILVNQAARGAARDRAQATAERLRRSGFRVTVDAPGAATAMTETARAAAAAGADFVVAAGGDATAAAVAAGLVGSSTALGLIPAGAANVLAGEIDAPRNEHAFARMAMQGARVPLALGFANGAPFLVVAGAGLDGAAAGRVDAALKRRFGALAYGVAIAHATLTHRSPRLRVEFDGTRQEADWALALNARLWPGSLHDGAPGRMRLALIAAADRLGRSRALAGLAMGRLALVPGVRLASFSRAIITADPPAPTHADGCALGATPLTLVVAPAPVWALVRP